MAVRKKRFTVSSMWREALNSLSVRAVMARITTAQMMKTTSAESSVERLSRPSEEKKSRMTTVDFTTSSVEEITASSAVTTVSSAKINGDMLLIPPCRMMERDYHTIPCRLCARAYSGCVGSNFFCRRVGML